MDAQRLAVIIFLALLTLGKYRSAVRIYTYMVKNIGSRLREQAPVGSRNLGPAFYTILVIIGGDPFLDFCCPSF